MLNLSDPFQSLIGNLQTETLEYKFASVDVFQSLIGNLQTVQGMDKVCIRYSMFQSLIGNLQTSHGEHDSDHGICFNPS